MGEGLYLSPIRMPQTRERIERAFARAHVDARVGGPLGRELALNGLEEVLLLARREHQLGVQHPRDPRVQQVLDLIANDLAARHDVTALARAVHLSPSRLAHLFKAEVGASVTDTTIALRLNQAARLLEHTVSSIGDIAAEVGFRSAYYFSRQFRRRFGKSPREYRATVTSTVTPLPARPR